MPSKCYNIRKNKSLGSNLAREESNQLLEAVTVWFKIPHNYDLEDIVKIGNFINTRRGIRLITIDLVHCGANEDPPSMLMYTLASLLLQTVKNHVREHDVAVRVCMEAHISTLDPVASFLRSSASMITNFVITTVGSTNKQNTNFASAVSSLENLKYLVFGSKKSCSDPRLLYSVLMELIHHNKVKLEILNILGYSFPGLGLFLASDSATGLKQLGVGACSLSRPAAIEIKTGLMRHPSIVFFLVLALDPEEDTDGLALLLDFLGDESPISSLQVASMTDNDHGLLEQSMSAWKYKNNLQTLRLPLRRAGEEDFTGRLLLQNQQLETLELHAERPALDDPQCFQRLAEGLGDSRSLRSLRLQLEKEEELPDVPLDCSIVIDAIPDQIEDFSLVFPYCPATPSTWSSLTELLQRPRCSLQTINIQFQFSGEQQNMLALIKAIKGSSTLKSATLDFGDDYNDTDYKDICCAALGPPVPSSLTELSIDLPEYPHQDLPEAEQKEIRDQVLECMEANTHLESVKLVPVSNDLEFELSLKSLCLRNKTLNAGKRVEKGSLEPKLLPAILADIEKECYLLGESTDLHFVNIWFHLLRSHPLEAKLYCPP